MAKMKFDFVAYQKADHIYSNVEDENVFEVVVGTKRMVLDDIMDKAAQDILKSARFRLVKNDNHKK